MARQAAPNALVGNARSIDNNIADTDTYTQFADP
jgi:hypothetical protein